MNVIRMADFGKIVPIPLIDLLSHAQTNRSSALFDPYVVVQFPLGQSNVGACWLEFWILEAIHPDVGEASDSRVVHYRLLHQFRNDNKEHGNSDIMVCMLVESTERS
jgi:hypothetical protein